MVDAMLKVKLAWSGFQGAPGYSMFYFKEFQDGTGINYTQAQVDGVAAAVTSFAQTVSDCLPAGVVLQTQTDIEVIESSDGKLIDIKTAGAQLAKAASQAAAAYSAPSGAVINWRTGLVHKNRRVRGRTFIVPLASICYESNGTLNQTYRGKLETAAAGLMNGTGYPPLGVWARPTRVKDANGVPTGVVTPDGRWGDVSSYNVPDLAAVLRSRRD